ncbi:alpha/beta-hydrolase [Neoconidiobolus thromboides FSU 785]|nr:alpha/beta-hydrolase [Neoconidiobolus thromboides FSU 785]
MNSTFDLNNPDSYHHKTIQLKDKIYHYVEEGLENAPYVLLLHGFPESWYMWKYQISYLVEKGYHVVAFDMPGYGETKVENKLENYTLKVIAEDIHTIFTENFQQNKVYIIAHDWGSFVGWELAYRYPENIQGYISLSIPYFPTLGEPKSERQKAEAFPVLGYQVALNEGNIGEFDQNVEKFVKAFYITVPNFDKTNYLKVPLDKSLFDHFDTFDNSKSEYIDENYLNYLIKQFKIQGTQGPTNWYRTSLLNGKNDQEKPNLNISVKCLQIINGGHWIQYLNYEKVNSLIGDFLKQV